MSRLASAAPLEVGATNEMRVLVCVEGAGEVAYGDGCCAIQKGDVMLLPAAVGVCRLQPERPITLLEIAVPLRS